MKKILPLLVCFGLLLSTAVPVSAMIPVEEGEISQSPYEINTDVEGYLWVTDGNGVIWQIKATDGTYIKFEMVYQDPVISPTPVDARRMGDYFYWAEGYGNYFGRASVASGDYSLWQISDANRFYGTAIDSNGRLWATDGVSSQLYNLEIGVDGIKATVCSYPLPATANYLALQNDYLWLTISTSGPPTDYRILRINLNGKKVDETKPLDWWELPSTSNPFGIALDSTNHLWYADQVLNTIGELNPGNNKLESYPLPNDPSNNQTPNHTFPWMLAFQGSKVWFTGSSPEIIGILDPTTAQVFETTQSTGSSGLSPTCSQITKVENGTFSKTTGTLNWQGRNYLMSFFSTAWKYFQVPADGIIGPYVWGIASIGSDVFVVDSGRSKLLKLQELPTYSVYLPLVRR